jgi:hypothetical protein
MDFNALWQKTLTTMPTATIDQIPTILGLHASTKAKLPLAGSF